MKDIRKDQQKQDEALKHLAKKHALEFDNINKQHNAAVSF